MISVDDMRDWTNFLGGYEGEVHTPHMDALAERGIVFTNAHCPSPVCNPSRTAVMTGLMPSTTGIYDNSQWLRPNSPDTITMPRFFKNRGYKVVGSGKSFHHTAGNNPPDQWHHYFRIPWAAARRDEMETIRLANEWEEAVRCYLASISFADAQVGRVLEALSESPYADNTIIILWSDHGWHLGEKNHWHKSTLWEEATRVPFIIAIPGMKTAGKTSSAPVNLVSIFPTLINLLNLDTDIPFDGPDLSPLLNDPNEWTNLLAESQSASEKARYREVRDRLRKRLPKTWAKNAKGKSAYHFDSDRWTFTDKETGEVFLGKESKPKN